MNHSDSNPPSTATRAQDRVDLKMGAVAAIVVAAGRGQRFGAAENKVLLSLAGVPVWIRSVEALRGSRWIGPIVVVGRACDRPSMEADANRLGVSLVEGGAERFDSVRAGLDWLITSRVDLSWVAIHDAARPLVSTADVDAVIQAAVAHQAAILATPVRGTLKRGDLGREGGIVTVDRRELWEALTPQVFSAAVIRPAYDRHRGRPATDDAELVERTGTPVFLVTGSAENLKITQAEDLEVAEAIYLQRTHLNKQP
ncbi:MAG: 2-C-methyl-D-erythritol 4-phosphate cytidylyltransferase [Planctomycetaceae bacterium]